MAGPPTSPTSPHEPDAAYLSKPRERSIADARSSSTDADETPPSPSMPTAGGSAFNHQDGRDVECPITPDEDIENSDPTSQGKNAESVEETISNHGDVLDGPQSNCDEEADEEDVMSGVGAGEHAENAQDAGDHSEDEVDEDFHAILPKKRSKTKAEREASRGKKPGNPGRFKGESLALMEQLFAEYEKIDKRKGLRGKLKRLNDFWHRARSAIWEKFSWEEFDQHHTGDKVAIVAEVNAAIPRWFQWRDGHINIGARNPWVMAVSALRKPDGHAPRKVAPYMIYASKHAGRVAAACPGGNIGDRNKKAREMLEGEAEEVRERFEEESRVRYEKEKEKFDQANTGLPSLDPDEQRIARDRLASVMMPLLERIAQHTGFTCVTLIGGMAVDDSWTCSAVNYGKTKDVIPAKFDEFDPAGFRKNFCGQFTKFLKACTSGNGTAPVEAPSAGAPSAVVAPSSTLTTATPTASLVPSTLLPTPSSSGLQSQQLQPLDSPRLDSDYDGGRPTSDPPPPRSVTRELSPTAAEKDAIDEDVILSRFNDAVVQRISGLPTEEKKEELARLQNLDEDETIRENAIAHRDQLLLELEITGPNSILGELSSTTRSGNGKPNKRTATKTKAKPRPKPKPRPRRVPRDGQSANFIGDTDPSGSAETNGSDEPGGGGGEPDGDVPISADGLSRSATDSDAPPARTTAGREAPLIVPPGNVSDAPAWFQAQYQTLARAEENMISEQRIPWLSTLKTWYDWEMACGFSETKAGFPTTFRPSEVALWIQNARKYPIVPKNHAKYRTQWWKWWIAANPGWRTVEDERPVITGTGDWSSMFKSGPNGFLTIFASLLGLRHAVNAEEWDAALKDVQWVLGQVYQAKQVSGTKHARSDENEDENNVPEMPVAKRQRRASGFKGGK